MSLIQEALRRQQMEQEGTLPPPKAKPPVAAGASPSDPLDEFILPGLRQDDEPTPTHPARSMERIEKEEDTDTEEASESRRVSPSADEPKSKSKVFRSLAAVLIVLLLLLGAASWALIYGLEKAGIHMPWTDKTPADVVTPAVADAPQKTQPAPDAATPPVAAKPKPTIASRVKSTIKDANTAAKASDAVIDETTTVQPAATTTTVDPVVKTTEPPAVNAGIPPVTAPNAATEQASAEPVTVAEPTTPPPPVAVQPPEPLVWPTITITGVVGKDRSGAAVINGKVVGVNDTIDNVRVVAIQHQGALLEYKGETQVIKVGKPIKSGRK